MKKYLNNLDGTRRKTTKDDKNTKTLVLVLTIPLTFLVLPLLDPLCLKLLRRLIPILGMDVNILHTKPGLKTGVAMQDRAEKYNKRRK